MSSGKRLTLNNNIVYILFRGARRFFSLRKSLHVSISCIEKIEILPASRVRYPGIKKLYGTNLPGFYYGGVFIENGKRVFWNARCGRDLLVMSLKDHPFHKVYLDSDSIDEEFLWLRRVYDKSSAV